MHRHETDVTSLVAGLVLVGIALVWALVELDVLTVSMLPTAVPAVLLTVGVVGVATALARSRRDSSTDQI